MILLYLLGAFSVGIGGLFITLELLSISVLATRDLSPLHQSFPALSDWITVPIALVTGIPLICAGLITMKKAWGDDADDE